MLIFSGSLDEIIFEAQIYAKPDVVEVEGITSYRIIEGKIMRGREGRGEIEH